jgi:hypothetical protein
MLHVGRRPAARLPARPLLCNTRICSFEQKAAFRSLRRRQELQITDSQTFCPPALNELQGQNSVRQAMVLRREIHIKCTRNASNEKWKYEMKKLVSTLFFCTTSLPVQFYLQKQRNQGCCSTVYGTVYGNTVRYSKRYGVRYVYGMVYGTVRFFAGWLCNLLGCAICC